MNIQETKRKKCRRRGGRWGAIWYEGVGVMFLAMYSAPSSQILNLSRGWLHTASYLFQYDIIILGGTDNVGGATEN